MQPKTSTEELQRAERARQLLEDPFYAENFLETEKAILEQLLHAPVKDKDLTLALVDTWRGLHFGKRLLETHMETGKLAKEQIRREEDRKKILGIF
jgi:hypothetical protein